MLTSNSILLTIVDRIRTELDEAETDAKYTNDYMLSTTIPNSLGDVLSRLDADRKNKVVVKWSFSTVKDQEFYRVPSNIAQVVDLFFVDSNELITGRMPHRDERNALGPGYNLQGNELQLDPLPTGAFTCELWYTPRGGFLPHYATDGTLDAAKDTITLSSSPASGRLDRREGAYNGAVVRVIPSSGPVEEAIIQSHTWDGSNWLIELRRPLVDTDEGTITYEIVDQPTLGLMDSVVYAACIRIATSRRVSGSALRNLQIMYNTALKTEGDRVANYDPRDNKWQEKTRYRRFDPIVGILGY